MVLPPTLSHTSTYPHRPIAPQQRPLPNYIRRLVLLRLVVFVGKEIAVGFADEHGNVVGFADLVGPSDVALGIIEAKQDLQLRVICLWNAQLIRVDRMTQRTQRLIELTAWSSSEIRVIFFRQRYQTASP
jgi:hypothetical protein